MWLIILAFAAAMVTPMWYSMAEEDKYLLRLLCLILWGATIMVFVDHVMGFLMEGGEFLEMTLDATVLGFAMLVATLVIWNIVLLLKDPKKVLYKKRANKPNHQLFFISSALNVFSPLCPDDYSSMDGDKFDLPLL